MSLRTRALDLVQHKDRHAHGLLFNSERERTYVFDGYGEYKVGVGDILFFPKHTDYHARIEPGSFCDVINFDLTEDISDFSPLVITPKNTAAIEAVFKSAERAWATKKESAKLKCMGKLYEIFTLIKQDLELDYVPSEQALKLKPALDFIDGHFTVQLPTIGELAAMCGISEGYFRAIFAAHTGQSPIDYLTNVRISHAKELIRSGLCSITDAAVSCGYTDNAYFSRAFKRVTGMSPREYKNSGL